MRGAWRSEELRSHAWRVDRGVNPGMGFSNLRIFDPGIEYLLLTAPFSTL